VADCSLGPEQLLPFDTSAHKSYSWCSAPSCMWQSVQVFDKTCGLFLITAHLFGDGAKLLTITLLMFNEMGQSHIFS